MTQIILGAGPLGTTLAAKLGADAKLFSIMGNPAYNMIGTSPQTINGADVAQVTGACKGAEVIYLCLNTHYVDWYGLFPPRLNAAIEAAAATGAKLIYHDSVTVYGAVKGPLKESVPYTTSIRQGVLRAGMANTLMDAVKSGKVKAAIGRTADMYGPGALNSSFNSTLGQRHFYPLLGGKAVSVLGNIKHPHTYAFVDDVADGLMTLAREDTALGQVFHLPAAPTLSHKELLTLAFEVAGLPPKINGSVISGYFLRGIGMFQKDVKEVAELLYMFEKPFVVSHQKFEAAFGANPTPHREALATTLDWYRANPLPG